MRKRKPITIAKWSITCGESNEYNEKISEDAFDAFDKIFGGDIAVMDVDDNLYVNWAQEKSNYDDPEGYTPDDVKPIKERSDRIMSIIECSSGDGKRVYIIRVNAEERDEIIMFKLTHHSAGGDIVYSGLYRVN